MIDTEVSTEAMTSVEKMIPLQESPATVHEEKLQEQNRQIEQANRTSTRRIQFYEEGREGE